MADEFRDHLRLVLLVAVHRDDPVVAARVGMRERVDKRLAIAAVLRMADELDVVA